MVWLGEEGGVAGRGRGCGWERKGVWLGEEGGVVGRGRGCGWRYI